MRTREDWTMDESGRSNSSKEYLRLCAAVAELIRESGHALINGGVDRVAGLIMAQLAHVHRLVPRATPDA